LSDIFTNLGKIVEFSEDVSRNMVDFKKEGVLKIAHPDKESMGEQIGVEWGQLLSSRYKRDLKG